MSPTHVSRYEHRTLAAPTARWLAPTLSALLAVLIIANCQGASAFPSTGGGTGGPGGVGVVGPEALAMPAAKKQTRLKLSHRSAALFKHLSAVERRRTTELERTNAPAAISATRFSAPDK